MAAASVHTCAVPSSTVSLSKNWLSRVWEQVLHVDKALHQISVDPVPCWGGAGDPSVMLCVELCCCSQNRLKCPLSVVVRHLMGTGPECLRTCQVSCRLGGRSSFIIAFLQIMGVTAYFAQGCAGSFYGRVGDHGVQILGVPYPWWLCQFNRLQMQILGVDYLAGELFHTCFPLHFLRVELSGENCR